MSVLRIVSDIAAGDPAAAKAFYGDVLGLEIAMDQGWIITFAADTRARPQVTVLSTGGSGAPVPDISIEVDDLDAVRARAEAAGFVPTYGPVSEPWGVRRFFVRDPANRLLNILEHQIRE